MLSRIDVEIMFPCQNLPNLVEISCNLSHSGPRWRPRGSCDCGRSVCSPRCVHQDCARSVAVIGRLVASWRAQRKSERRERDGRSSERNGGEITMSEVGRMEGGFATLPRSATTVSRNRYRIPRCMHGAERAGKVSAKLGSRDETENVGERGERARGRKVGGRSCEKINEEGGRERALAACRVRCVTPARSPLYRIVWVRWCHLPAISGVTWVSPALPALVAVTPYIGVERVPLLREKEGERRSNLNQPNLTVFHPPLCARATMHSTPNFPHPRPGAPLPSSSRPLRRVSTSSHVGESTGVGLAEKESTTRSERKR